MASWFKLDSSQSSSSDKFAIFGNNQNSPILGYQPSATRFVGRDDVGNMFYISTSSNLADSSWHHIVMTIDLTQGQIKHYLNGTPIGTTPYTPVFVGGNQLLYRFGNAYIAGGVTAWDGVLDEIRIYERALSPNEVKQLYEWAPGPVGYWDFEEGSGDTAFDRSGNGNNGSITGASYTQGKYGKAANFDGNGDYITVSDSSSLSPTHAVTIEAWIKPDATPGDAGKSTPYFGIATKDGGFSGYPVYGLRLYNDLKIGVGLAYGGSSSDETSTAYSSSSVSLSTWTHVAMTYDQSVSTRRTYINGNLEDTSTAYNNLIFDSSDPMYIGLNDGRYFSGSIDDVKIYNYARTAEQVRQDMMGDGQSTAAGANPLPSPVAHWSFDEMQGQTANDKVGGNNGTLGADGNAGTDDPTWTSSGKVNGALSFDGGDFVQQSAPTSVKIPNKTITFWAKPPSITTTVPIVSLTGANWYAGFANNNAMITSHRRSTDNNQQTTYSDNFSVINNAWSHYAYSFAVTGSDVLIKMYINGKEIKSTSYTTGYSTNYDSVLVLGSHNTSTSFYTGILDEVKIYNSALSAEQVRQDMNAGSTLAFGGVAGNSEAADMTDGAGDPPIAYWDFEEKSGSTLHDKSGNGNDGTLGVGNSAPSWTSGCKYGACLEFDGDDFITYSSLDLGTTHTISVWINTQSTDTQAVIGGQSGGPQSYGLLLTSTDSIHYKTQDITVSTTHTRELGTWYHISITRNGTAVKWYVNGILIKTNTLSSDLPLTVGALGAFTNGYTPFNGKIDQVKIYDYARTPAQIAYDYNRGAPIAHWKFNECEGSTIHDSSGNGNHGTLAVTTDGGNSAGVGTCNTGSSAWGSGATGKFGSSLNFDGDGDYVDIPSHGSELNLTGDLTMSTWVKTTSSSDRFIYSGTASNWGHRLYTITGGAIKADFIQVLPSVVDESITSTIAINDGLWHHIVVTRTNGSDMNLYIDGKLNKNETAANLNLRTGTGRTIGAYNTSGYFPGQIDDVQIYNYALSASQVKKLYNQNSAIRFGP